MNWTILILALFLIVCEAVFEGLSIRGKHLASELIELVYRAVLTLVLFAWVTGIKSIINIDVQFIRVIIGYVFLRFSIFDPIWNLAAGQPINFVGSTKLFDKFLQEIRNLWGMNSVWFVRFIAGFWGVAWLLGK